AQRHAGSNTFGYGDDVRLHARVLNGPHLSCAPGARLHFIRNQQDAVLITDAPQLLHVLARSRDVPAFTLDWLNKDGRALFRRHDGLEHPVFNEADALPDELRFAHAFRPAISVWKRHVRHTGHNREESPPLLDL